MKKQTISSLKKYAWKLCSEYIRMKHPVCQICNRAESDDAHHVIPRKKSNYLYFSENNLIAVCRSCHNKLHPVNRLRCSFDPCELQDIYERIKGKKVLAELNRERHRIQKDSAYFLNEVIAIYKERLKELKYA